MPYLVKNKRFPKYVIMDVSWLNRYNNLNNWILNKFTIRDFLETITKIPVYDSCDEYIWMEIERRFTPAELDQISSDQFLILELLTESFIAEFYERLYEVLPEESDHYVFHSWYGKNVLILIRADQRDSGVDMNQVVLRR